jgi:hypothetical protein
VTDAALIPPMSTWNVPEFTVTRVSVAQRAAP